MKKYYLDNIRWIMVVLGDETQGIAIMKSEHFLEIADRIKDFRFGNYIRCIIWRVDFVTVFRPAGRGTTDHSPECHRSTYSRKRGRSILRKPRFSVFTRCLFSSLDRSES